MGRPVSEWGGGSGTGRLVSGGGGASGWRGACRPAVRGGADDGIVLVRVPEGAIVHRIDRQHAVVSPAAARVSLIAAAGDDHAFSLRKRPQRIGAQPSGVADRP